jgi:hypothetical protein
VIGVTLDINVDTQIGTLHDDIVVGSSSCTFCETQAREPLIRERDFLRLSGSRHHAAHSSSTSIKWSGNLTLTTVEGVQIDDDDDDTRLPLSISYFFKGQLTESKRISHWTWTAA